MNSLLSVSPLASQSWLAFEMEAVVSVYLPGRENVLINYSRRKGVGEEKRDGGEVVKTSTAEWGYPCNQLEIMAANNAGNLFYIMPSFPPLHLLLRAQPLFPSSCFTFTFLPSFISPSSPIILPLPLFRFISSSAISRLPVSLPPVFSLVLKRGSGNSEK